MVDELQLFDDEAKLISSTRFIVYCVAAQSDISICGLRSFHVYCSSMQIKTPGILQTLVKCVRLHWKLFQVSEVVVRSRRKLLQELSEVVVRSRRKFPQEASELLLKLFMRCPSVRNALSEEK